MINATHAVNNKQSMLIPSLRRCLQCHLQTMQDSMLTYTCVHTNHLPPLLHRDTPKHCPPNAAVLHFHARDSPDTHAWVGICIIPHCTQFHMRTQWPPHVSIWGDLLTQADRRGEVCLAKGSNDLMCGQEPTWLITSAHEFVCRHIAPAGGSSFPAFSKILVAIKL